MTQEQLVVEFINGAVEGVSGGGGNLKIKQNKLIHYQTSIAQREPDKIILNMTRYSLVTGRIQKMVREKTKSEELAIVYKVPEGYCGDLKEFIIE